MHAGQLITGSGSRVVGKGRYEVCVRDLDTLRLEHVLPQGVADDYHRITGLIALLAGRGCAWGCFGADVRMWGAGDRQCVEDSDGKALGGWDPGWMAAEAQMRFGWLWKTDPCWLDFGCCGDVLVGDRRLSLALSICHILVFSLVLCPSLWFCVCRLNGV